MPNNKLFAILSFLFLLPISPALSSAPYNPNSGQATSSYSNVIFDERGLALVLNRIEFHNLDKNPLTEISVEIPGNNVALKYALEGLQGCTQQCAQYENSCTQYQKVCDVWDYSQNSCTKWRDECKSYSNNCVRYQDVCNNYYDDYSTSFSLLDVEKISANTFKLKLDKPVLSGKSAVILISYRVTGYVKQGLAQDFDFPTIKYPFDVDYTRVSVQVDQGLVLKGGESRSDYVTSYNAFEGALAAAPAKQSISGSSLDFARSVKYAAGFVKEKSNLLAGETFHVTGSYASSSWKLYAFDWLIWLVAIIIVLFLIWKFAFPIIVSAFDKILPPASAKAKKDSEFNAGRVMTSGILSATVFAVFSALLYILISLLDRANAWSMHDGGVILLLYLALGIFAAIAVFLFMNARYGVMEGLGAAFTFVGFTLIMTPAAVFLAFVILQIVFPPRYYY